MSEFMRPMAFSHLMEWCKEEYEQKGSIFGVPKEKFFKSEKTFVNAFGDELSSPVGPAAGPQSQLAQNIIASYLAGARFMEVKTVQIMDGEEIQNAVARPCIFAEDECYNCEWSTELTVPQAFAEYLKAYFAIHVLAKELGLADKKDFAYNLSVGYNLEGIQSEKIDTYIEGMKDASETEVFKACYAYLAENLDQFEMFNAEDLQAISPKITNSITLSTLHGCPADEIEKIAHYLLTTKKMHTFVKFNPTMLGYDYARKTLDELGYDYISFTDFHYKNDLQYEDAVEMIKRLRAVGKENGLQFGLKITNTCPVDVKRNELPSEEMYMSGRSLLPLSISLAHKISSAFNGEIPISYSGGMDALNIESVLKAGIQPITMATTLLKPGGYERFYQLAKVCEPSLADYNGIDVAKLTQAKEEILSAARTHKLYREKIASRKTDSELPLFDCFKAPCKDGGCPINQQIPEYLKLVAEGKYEEAMKVIAIDNTSPSILGLLCSHTCQEHCTRLDYEKSLQIRQMKKIATDEAQENFLKGIQPAPLTSEKKVAIIGAGPAGIAAAIYLRRNGIQTVVYEKREAPYGIVKYIIPRFRIPDETIDRDFRIAVAEGVEFKFGADPNYDVNALRADYDYVIIATGAWKQGNSPVSEGQENVVDALDFLWKMKNEDGFNLGKRVAVVGAGDVAMDCARLADRQEGVEEVCVVYRRTESYMPAMQEDVNEVKEEGIKIYELMAPKSYKDQKLVCEVMKLGDFDASGRKAVEGTGELVEMQFDTVIGATGAKVDISDFERNGINLDERGRVKLTEQLESNIENVFVIGDCKRGPSTIVRALADAKNVTKYILEKEKMEEDFVKVVVDEALDVIYGRRGVLEEARKTPDEGNRCLKCDQLCEMCTEVCPNRANIYIEVEGFDNVHQIVHIDGMCNECGNCGVFCPHAGDPYKDKVTVFWTEEDFVDSTNVGFLRIKPDTFKVRTETGEIFEHVRGDGKLSEGLEKYLTALLAEYEYFFNY